MLRACTFCARPKFLIATHRKSSLVRTSSILLAAPHSQMFKPLPQLPSHLHDPLTKTKTVRV